MLVVSETTVGPLGDLANYARRSSTMCLPSASTVVRQMSSQASGALLNVDRTSMNLSGLRGLDSVPTWAWAVGGGIIAGAVVGALVFRKGRGKRRR